MTWQPFTSKWLASSLIFVALSSNIVPASPSTTYDVGLTYNYQYATTVMLNEPEIPRAKNITFKVKVDVAATSVWQNPTIPAENILLLQISNPKLLVVPKSDNLGELIEHASTLDDVKDEAIYLHMKEGAILELYTENTQTSSLLNVYAGIASLFQLQPQHPEIVEIDSSGRCDVTYKSSGSVVHKYKANCKNLLETEIKSNPLKHLDIKFHSEIVTTYHLNKANVIESSESLETRVVLLKTLKSIGSFIQSKQTLNLVSEENGKVDVVEGANAKDALEHLKKSMPLLKSRNFNVQVKAKKESCQKFSAFINNRRKLLKKSDLERGYLLHFYLEAVQRIQFCSKDVLVEVLKNSKNKAILPRLLDVYAASQTTASLQAVLEVLDFNSEETDLVEHFLISLSASPVPSLEVLKEILELLKGNVKSGKLQATLISTIGSLVEKYLKNNDNSELEKDVFSLFVEKLSECQDEVCKLSYIRGFQMAALPSSLPVVLNVLNTRPKKERIAALKVISALFKDAPLPDEVRATLIRVYHQIKETYDTSSRLLAALILLRSKPDAIIIKDILNSLIKASPEFNTYVVALIQETAYRNSEFKNKLKEVLQDQRVFNYNTLAQNGNSAVFTNPLLIASDFNLTYAGHVEMSEGGLIKFGDFTLEATHDEDYLRLFTFGIFAGGLSGALGGGDGSTDSEEVEDLTAGIELEIFGSAIRPYTFFTGQGELMGLIWSGTGSEKTEIINVLWLLQNQQLNVILQSGFIVDISMLAAVAGDLSGLCQISIWNRNSHSNIFSRVSAIQETVTRLESDYVKAFINMTSIAEVPLDFTFDASFSQAPFQLCLQMEQPPFSSRQIITKVEKTHGTKHYKRHIRRSKHAFPSRSFAVNKMNSLHCSEMFEI